MKHRFTHLGVCLLLLACPALLQAQFLTREDSLSAGLSPNAKSVILAGYGEAKVSYNQNLKTAEANYTRNVLFVGYRFTKKITFFSEIELEDTKVDHEGGEISLEQGVLKLDVNRNHYFLTGLFIPRIGMLNENHLPITFNGNDRHMVERMILPSTWREIGVGYYGRSQTIPGLNWSLGLMNGLNGANISGQKGIKDAKFEGREATASNLAVTGSLLYYFMGFRLQASAYYGGTVGLTPRAADSLGLNSGPFGTPVALGEANVTYTKKGFVFKALGTYVSIPDAQKLNTAYASNAPKTMYGYFAELGYNLLYKDGANSKNLTIFTRYEGLDMMASVPDNGIKDDLYKQNYIVSGLTYFPTRGVAIKFDWKHVTTGTPNPALIFNPSPNAPAYQTKNNIYQLGIAYSF